MATGRGVGWGQGLGSPQPACSSPRKESVQRHVLRLLLHLHHRVAPSKLEALQKALEPTERSPEGPRHLHRIPRLSEAPWEVP